MRPTDDVTGIESISNELLLNRNCKQDEFILHVISKHLHMHGSKRTLVKLNRTRQRFPSDVLGFSSRGFDIFSRKRNKKEMENRQKQNFRVLVFNKRREIFPRFSHEILGW